MPEIELSESTIALLKDMFMGEQYSTLGELIDKLVLDLIEFNKEYQYAVSLNECHILRRGDAIPVCGSLAPYTAYNYLYPNPNECPMCPDCRLKYWGINEHISIN